MAESVPGSTGPFVLFLLYVQDANVEEINAQGVHKITLHDNPSSQMLLAHPRIRLQSSPLDIIYFIMLLISYPKERYQ